MLVDAEKLVKRALHVSPQLKFYTYYLLGHAHLQIFYDKLLAFQAKFDSAPKYKERFSKHVPHGGVAPGEFMLELPGFSDALRKFYKDHLEWARRALRTALEAARAEPVVFELDATVADCLRALAEACFLASEYRARVLAYKWARFEELDVGRKVQRIAQLRREAEQAVDDSLL